MKHSFGSLLHLIISYLLGATFIYAGALKAWDPLTFADDIEHFRLLHWTLVLSLAFYLPWLEILCGVVLCLRRWQRGALVIQTSLMLVFLVATISAHLRGINLNCGCFGSASKGMSFTSHLLIDLALLMASLFVGSKEWARDQLTA